MRRRPSIHHLLAFAATAALLGAVACTGETDTLRAGAFPGEDETGTPERAAETDGDGERDGGGAAPTDAGATTAADGGGEASAPPPAPECKPGLTSASLTLPSATLGPVRAAPMPDDGTTIAWGSGGQIHVRRLDWSGAAVGADRSVPGRTVHGVAPMADGVALLVARAPDVLALVKVSDAGDVVFDQVLVGNQDHGQLGSEWFAYQPQFFAQAGRLVWNGSRLFAYFPFYHLSSNGEHTGDTLRAFDAAGKRAPGSGWNWGCSHSLDVRLSADGSTPVCLSDCYPQKGILVGSQSLVSSEPSGNCAGTSNAKLGGLATVGGASWLTFASREGRSSRDVALVKLGQPTKRWLTSGPDATAPHLAAYGTQMLAGWRIGAAATVQVIDTQGAPVGQPRDVSSLAFGEGDDFLSWPGGDAGWLSQSGTSLKIARLGACD